MIPKIVHNYLLIAICLILSVKSYADDVSHVVINVASAGTLSSLLGNKVDSVVDLTLLGELNGSDIKAIRSMDVLSVLNLAETKIVSGGEAYYTYITPWSITVNCYTSTNVIGSWFFNGCSKLTSVILPTNVTIIATRAFNNCSNLASIIIPIGVDSIGDYAFSSCSSLTSIALPKSVLTVDPTAFIACNEMTQILVDAENPNLCSIDGVLFSKDKKSLLIFPWGKSSNEYFIPDGVLTIETKAFYNCLNVFSVRIPKSVTTLKDYAFGNCNGLTAIYCMASTPPSLKSWVFNNIDKTIVKLFVPKASYDVYRTTPEWSKFINTIVDEGPYSRKFTFKVDRPGSLSSFLGNYVDSVRDLTITGSLNGTDIGTIRSMDSLSILNIEDANILSGGDTYFSNSSYYKTTDNTIGDYMFFGCKRLTSITVPKTVTAIGDQAFDYGITSIHIKTITLPNVKPSTFVMVNKNICKLFMPIGAYVTYPSTPVWSDLRTFVLDDVGVYDKPLLIHVAVPGSLPVFLGNSASYIKDLTLTGFLNGSDIGAIRSLSIISLLNLADATIVSGGAAYYTLFSTPYYSKDNEIGDYSFRFIRFTSIILPKSVTRIGDFAFATSSALTSVTIPNGVTTIGESAFQGAFEMQTITLPNTLISIGNDAFSECSKLKSILIPSSVKSLGEQAFEYCGRLDSITLPIGIPSIGRATFRLCGNLKSITIPASVTSIGDGAFSVCSGLTKIYCKSNTPPSIGSLTFDYVNKSSCIIHIPMGSYDSYHSAYGWKDFQNIIEDVAIPIINVQDNVEIVYTVNNSILIKGAPLGTEISIYNLLGRLIQRTKVMDDITRFIVPVKGVYLVKESSKTMKVVL